VCLGLQREFEEVRKASLSTTNAKQTICADDLVGVLRDLNQKVIRKEVEDMIWEVWCIVVK
jgi:hypothetical protein